MHLKAYLGKTIWITKQSDKQLAHTLKKCQCHEKTKKKKLFQIKGDLRIIKTT